jgi:hypothetical protein
MLSAKKIIGIAVIFMGLFLCLQSQSYASTSWSFGFGVGEEHGYSRHHRSSYGRPHFGLRVAALPRECYTVWSDGVRYEYCDGYYYYRDRVDYVVVNPPVGTVLTSVPVTYQPVVVNGTTYYTNNGVYYIYTSAGYQVVPAPTAVLQSPPAVSQLPVDAAATTATDDNSFTVNIPNGRGGYTAVLLKVSGKGYVGPQGEFYSEFPKVSQLKAMYAK